METSSAPVGENKGIENTRAWDWRAALLTLALVEISSTRLVITEWAPFLYFTQTMAFLGAILGLALGYSRFSRKAVIRIAAGYTLILAHAQLLVSVERTDWLWDDIATLFGRLFYSLEQFITNKPVYDHLFFISFVTLAYWLIGVFAGYWLTRHWDFLNVVLPSGVAILTVQAFDPPRLTRVWELGVFVFVALLLLGRIHFLKNRSFWNKSNFLLTDEAVTDLERGTLAVTTVAALIAWSLPGWISSVKPAAEAWRDFSQPIFDKFSNAVSALESPYAINNTGGEFYGSSLFLGEQAATGENIIFLVKVKESDFTPIRNYWKGRNYDLYYDGRWIMAEYEREPFEPTKDVLTAAYAGDRYAMEYIFTSRAKRQSLLYAPAETIWVSKEASVESVPIAGELKDVIAWVADKKLASGDQYRVKSLIADPSVEELRAAGVEYPAWVTERYLQIPKKIEPQLKELALEITASQETPYDKAQAITTYLRSEIEYNETVEEVPPDTLDPVLWVLFEHRKGFCMYYASAETLMLRSIGIPARMAVGFAQGTFDEEIGQYKVAYKDSHAWPEVYFPDIGWVEFEPTSNQSPIKRPEMEVQSDEIVSDLESGDALGSAPLRPDLLEDPLDPLLLDDGSGSQTAAVEQPAWYLEFIAPSLVLLAVGLFIFVMRHYSLNERLPVYLVYQYERRGSIPPRWIKRWARWTGLSQLERAFQSINLGLYWLGRPQAAHVTPQKRAEELVNCLPEAQDEILSLLQEYQDTLFTPHPGDLAAARKAALRILVRTWRFRIKETLQSINRRYNQFN
jgi:transglutaminase-like putative cysteine protease